MSTLIRARRPDLVLPAWASSPTAKRGMELADLRSLGIIPGLAGGDRGYNASGDVLTQTQDGVDLNQLWRDYQDFLEEWNNRRDPLVNFLTWRTTNVSEDLFQSGELAEFEEASEYGEPVGYRPKAATYSLGYTFKWYDMGARFTWQYLADAMSAQVDAVANMAAEADNRNVFKMVLQTLFNNTRRTNKEGNTVYPFYAGAAGDDPEDFGSTTFADLHNHFVTTNTATLDPITEGPLDLQALQGLLTEHGYTESNGYRLVLLINEAQEGAIRNFRSAPNGGPAGSIYDFIPATGTEPFMMPTDLQIEPGAARPASSLAGLEVVGKFGQFIIIKNEWIPAGYMAGFATGGTENVLNPVAIREHPNAGLRGLRLVKGRTPDYPLIDSFYNRGFGTGIRYRGAGAIMQIKVGATYDVPPAYAW